MNTILVTAFEPFGLRNTPLFSENASKNVLQALAGTFGRDVICEVLPVSKHSENVLLDLCALHRPAGILMLGESLIQSPGEICVEPYAVDTVLNRFPIGGVQPIVMSAFAEKILEGKRNSSSIGSQECNRCYLRALGWASANGSVPVVFIHIPVFGVRRDHARQVLEVFHRLKEAVNTPS